MRRGGVGAIASSPIMVGAVTTLIVILAVFLAYNANNGLPFVPSYRISVQVPNAETLVPGNDVRIGGVRVGFVEDVVPVQHKDGRVTAKADLKLDKNVDPIPVGSTVVVRAKSALGLKYLEINRHRQPQRLSGGLHPAAQGGQPAPGRVRPGPEHVQRARPGRRSARTWSSSAPSSPAVGPRSTRRSGSCGRCSADSSRWRGTWPPRRRGWRGSSARPGTRRRRWRPSPQTQAHMFVVLDTTFGALASVARPFIQDTITETPPTFDTLIDTSPRISTFLGTTPRCSPTCGRACTRSTRTRRRSRRRSRPARGCCPAPRRSMPSSRPRPQSLGAVRDRTRTSRAGISRSTQTVELS